MLRHIGIIPVSVRGFQALCCSVSRYHRYAATRGDEAASTEPHNGDWYHCQLGEERWR